MNTIGKFLVLLNVTLSLGMLFWAVTIYFDPMDWGRKQARLAYTDPPKDKADKALPNSAIASEPAKQLAALQREVNARPRAELRLEKALRNRNSLETIYAENHRKYIELVKVLEESKDPVVVHELKYDRDLGTLELEPKGMTILEATGKKATDKDGNIVIDSGKRIGSPVFEKDALKDVNQSFATYAAELEKILENIFATSKKIEDWIEKEEKVTVRVNGVRDPLGKFITPGYYDLLELEAIAQRRLKVEIEYVEPLWVRELVNAQLLLERRSSLEYRLRQLKPVVGQ